MTSFDEFITYKELLLKDLCSRIPYKVKCQVYDDPVPHTLSGIIPSRVYQELYFEELDWKECDGFIDIKYSKPYLFPLSSMTEEQKCEYNRLKHDVPTYHYEYGDVVEDIELYDSPSSFEYLIEHRFDVYDLIPLGLANDATDKNIY